MNILALDLGTTCGWAAFCDGKIRSGVWDLRPTKFDSHGQRYLTFRRLLETEIVIDGVEKIYYEAVRRHIGTDAAQMYGGYMSHVQSVCLDHDVAYEGVPVQTIKKHATGKGNGDKQQMIDSAIKKFKNINIIDDNHADALHLLNYTLSLTLQ